MSMLLSKWKYCCKEERSLCLIAMKQITAATCMVWTCNYSLEPFTAHVTINSMVDVSVKCMEFE